MDILFLSPADWSGPKGRFQHIAERLALRHRVIYVDGLGLRSLSMADWRRCARKLGHFLRLSKDRDERIDARQIATLSPVPIPGQSPILRRVNGHLLERYFKAQLQRRDFRTELLWLAYPHPDLADLLDRIPHDYFVYDCVDSWGEFTGCYPGLADCEARLMRRADLVFTTAPSLQERALRYNERSFLVPNGCDLSVYAESADVVEPADLAGIGLPRIGFVGNIAEWLDMELLDALTRARPDWQFVLIGPWQQRGTPLRRDNLHWLGYRGYAEVPAYLAAFDVSIVPFQESELVRNADPLKIYEYLAAGLPVVSTPIPRLEEFGDLLAVASGPVAFQAAIESALAEDGAQADCRRRAMSSHSWGRRLEQMEGIARQVLGVELLPAAEAVQRVPADAPFKAS